MHTEHPSALSRLVRTDLTHTCEPGSQEEADAVARIDNARDEELSRREETFEERGRRWRRTQARRVSHDPLRYRP